jgi:hypothetical protein
MTARAFEPRHGRDLLRVDVECPLHGMAAGTSGMRLQRSGAWTNDEDTCPACCEGASERFEAEVAFRICVRVLRALDPALC